MGEQVFGKYVNDACVKRGKELLKEAKAEHKKKEDYGKKEIYQSAKEGATYLRNRARGKISLAGASYRCCECTHTINKKFKICAVCRNGSEFIREGSSKQAEINNRQ